MALNIALNLNDAQEAALNEVVTDYNARNKNTIGFVALTPTQYIRQVLREHIESQMVGLDERKQLSLREQYKKATAEEKTMIDNILAKYA